METTWVVGHFNGRSEINQVGTLHSVMLHHYLVMNKQHVTGIPQACQMDSDIENALKNKSKLAKGYDLMKEKKRSCLMWYFIHCAWRV